MLDDKEVQYLPAYHDIPADDHNRILLLSKVCCLVSLIIKVLELEKGIDADNLSFLEKDIKNFIQSQHSIEEENEGTEVLKLCKSLKDKDDAFQYDFTLDENNKLEHIIWVFGDSIRAYEAFGDAVIFDTTYGINRYDMPHGLWIGVDNCYALCYSTSVPSLQVIYKMVRPSIVSTRNLFHSENVYSVSRHLYKPKASKYQVGFLCGNLVNYKLNIYGLRSKNSQVKSVGSFY